MIEIISVILKHKKLLAASVLAAFLISAVISLVITPVYRSSATIIPIGFIEELASVKNYFSYLGSMGESFTAYARIRKNFIIHGIIRSRKVTGIIAERYDMTDIYQTDRFEEARERLLENTSVDVHSSGSISISFQNEDPELAARVVEAYVSTLDSIMVTLSAEDAEARSEFISREIERRESEIAGSDSVLMAFMQEHGVYQLEQQARAALEAAAVIRTRQELIEVKRGMLEEVATGENPSLKLIKLELKELDNQIRRMSQQGDRGNLFPPLSEFPSLASQYIQLVTRRELKEFALQYMRLKLEDARIISSRGVSSLRMVDPPFVPERRIWPKRKQIVLISTISVFLWACILIIAVEVRGRKNLHLSSLFVVGPGLTSPDREGSSPEVRGENAEREGESS